MKNDLVFTVMGDIARLVLMAKLSKGFLGGNYQYNGGRDLNTDLRGRNILPYP